MRVNTKISSHKHTGRLRPHEYTSYLPLSVLLLFVGLVLVVSSVSAQTSPQPQSGSVGLTGTMPGPPPTVAATITSPSNQQGFSTSPITVSGTCPKNTLVEIYKNDIFAGSTTCTSSGTYSLQVDLLIGENTLIAKVYNALDQPGPDSNPVIVDYNALPPQSAGLTPLNFSGSQLLLNTSAVYRGAFPGHQLAVPIDILGGTPPYALNIEWGDTKNSVVPRNNNITFNATHTYQKPGIYQITLQATDSQGRVAFLTVAAIINGQPAAAAVSSNSSNSSTTKLMVLWPLYVGSVAVVASFWMGERREKRILGESGLTLHAHSG